jgi:hypothetical protein
MRLGFRKKKPEERPRRDVVVHVPTVDVTAEALPVTVSIENRVSETENRLRKIENYLIENLSPFLKNEFDEIHGEFDKIAEKRADDRKEDTCRFWKGIVISLIALAVAIVVAFVTFIR